MISSRIARNTILFYGLLLFSGGWLVSGRVVNLGFDLLTYGLQHGFGFLRMRAGGLQLHILFQRRGSLRWVRLRASLRVYFALHHLQAAELVPRLGIIGIGVGGRLEELGGRV